MMKLPLVAIALLPTASTVAPASLQSPAARPETQQAKPAWVASHMDAMIGTWIADNAAYRSAQEPFDAFGIDWTWGIAKQSIVGRLYGLRSGKEIATFWEFREFWHPGEGQLLATQFGVDGTYGVGPHHRKPDGTMEMLQVFHGPTGPATRVGHRSELKGNEQFTHSFDVAADGTWKPRRTYVWRRKS
jgi:hypothetical protein